MVFPGMDISIRSPLAWAVPSMSFLAAVVIVLAGINVPVFRLLNGLGAYTGDGVWALLTLLGDHFVGLALALIVISLAPHTGGVVLISSLLVNLAIRILKKTLVLPRPLTQLGPDEFHLIGPMLKSGSFPSGHSATAFALAGLVTLGASPRQRRYLVFPVLILASMVAISRCAVGAHWPSDIAAGAGIGWVAAWLAFASAARWPCLQSVDLARALALVLMLVCVHLILFYDSRYPYHAWLQSGVGLTALGAGFWRFVLGWRSISPRANASVTLV